MARVGRWSPETWAVQKKGGPRVRYPGVPRSVYVCRVSPKVRSQSGYTIRASRHEGQSRTPRGGTPWMGQSALLRPVPLMPLPHPGPARHFPLTLSLDAVPSFFGAPSQRRRSPPVLRPIFPLLSRHTRPMQVPSNVRVHGCHDAHKGPQSGPTQGSFGPTPSLELQTGTWSRLSHGCWIKVSGGRRANGGMDRRRVHSATRGSRARCGVACGTNHAEADFRTF